MHSSAMLSDTAQAGIELCGHVLNAHQHTCAEQATHGVQQLSAMPKCCLCNEMVSSKCSRMHSVIMQMSERSAVHSVCFVSPHPTPPLHLGWTQNVDRETYLQNSRWHQQAVEGILPQRKTDKLHQYLSQSCTHLHGHSAMHVSSGWKLCC